MPKSAPPRPFSFEIKDLVQMILYVIMLTLAYAAFDKRLALNEQKMDAVVLVVETVNKLALDHDKRILILEQYHR